MSLNETQKLSQNPIIIEGLWGLGKTELAKRFCARHGYTLFPEPFHTLEHHTVLPADIDEWYVNMHQHRFAEFLGHREPALMERSALSSFAFAYALKKKMPDLNILMDLRREIRQRKIILAYITNADVSVFQKAALSGRYSKEVWHILADEDARSRYEHWYTSVLPLEYSITPFILPVQWSGVTATTNQLVSQLESGMLAQRIAQVNVVCFDASQSQRNEFRVLLLKRSHHKGGYWQTITGGVRPGESLGDAAIREVGEETGLKPDLKSFFSVPFQYSFMGTDGYPLFEYVFACALNGYSPVSLSAEHEMFKWGNLNDAKAMLVYENNFKAVTQAKEKAALIGLLP